MTTFLQMIAGLLITALLLGAGFAQAQSSESLNPILVELFTSEGCSSCPPADALLEKLNRVQPVRGAQLIVLSEHVDYWNHAGWQDPYSSRLYSERQSAYANRFGLSSDYTPQMVVDGRRQFVGSNAQAAEQALADAAKRPKIHVMVSNVFIDAEHKIRAHVEVDGSLLASSKKKVEIYVALVLTHAESQVSGGENTGRKISHTNVVRRLVDIANMPAGQRFARDIQLKTERGIDPTNLQVVAFVQEADLGQILGSAISTVKR